ncbi:MAG: biotin transporter BioY [Candidatus Dormibacteraeota bacterium]|nr:biotin transporter BioY [Candidatus Dormibacteraeota bacterium]
MATATRSRATLADRLPGAWTRDVIVVVLGAVITGLAAQVSFHIPGTPVPVTGQTFAVLLTGAALGLRRAALSMILYMAAGLVGVPWYANHASGFGGPAFGYIVAFIGAAALVGWLAAHGGDRTVPRTVVTMLAGTAAIYLVGATWLAVDLHVNAGTAWKLGVQPFLIGDAIKLVLAAGLLPGAWWLVGRDDDRGARPQP